MIQGDFDRFASSLDCMSDSFNGYHVWLGIPPTEQPPNHYRLLGIAPFETDLDVIDHAADRQMAHVRTYQSGRNAALSQQLLNELSSARICLLNVQRKADYDGQLRAELAAKSTAVPVGKALPMAKPAVAVVPRAAPIAKAAEVDDDTYEVESRKLAPLATRLMDDDDFPDPSSSAPTIELRAPSRLVDRDAALQRAIIYILMAVGVIVVILVLFGFLQRIVGTSNWREWFTVPSYSEPSEGHVDEPVPAPTPEAPGQQPPAPLPAGQDPDS